MDRRSEYEPLTLSISNRAATMLSITALTGMAAGGIVAFYGSLFGWMLVGGFAGALLLVRRKGVSTLSITFGGISLFHGGKTSSFTWKDIGGFRLARFHSRDLVTFDLSTSGKTRGVAQSTSLPRVREGEGECQFVIPENYGLKALALLELLQRWHTRWRR